MAPKLRIKTNKNPKPFNVTKGRPPVYPWFDTAIGKGFIIANEDGSQANLRLIQQRASAAARGLRKRYPEMIFITRIDRKDGVVEVLRKDPADV